MERHPVGVTGKLWHKVTDAERQSYLAMAEEGFSLRDIGRKFDRDHHVVAYALKEDKERLLLLEKARVRRVAKKCKPPDVVRANRKLLSCVMQARKRAERKHVPIDIDFPFLVNLYKQQGGICALTGIQMEVWPMPGHRTNPYAISLDRIDSRLGYTKDNVRLVIWCINFALAEWGESHFEELAKTYLWAKYGPRILDIFVSP